MSKRKTRKRVAAALKKYMRSNKNPVGKRIRKNSTTIRGAKAVNIRKNPDGTVHIKVTR